MRSSKRSSSEGRGGCKRRSMRWPCRLTGMPDLASPVANLDTLVGSNASAVAERLLEVFVRTGRRAAPAVTVDHVVAVVGVFSLLWDVSSPVDAAPTVFGINAGVLSNRRTT